MPMPSPAPVPVSSSAPEGSWSYSWSRHRAGWVLLMVGIVAALAVIAAGAIGHGSPSASRGNGGTTGGSIAAGVTAVDTPVPTNAPASAPSIRDIVTSQIDKDHLLREVDTPDYNHPKQTLVLIDFRAKDNLTQGLVATGIKLDIFNMMKALYTSGRPIGRVVISAWTPYQNTYGKAAWCASGSVVLTKGTADQIAWDNITSDDLWQDMEINKAIQFCD